MKIGVRPNGDAVPVNEFPQAGWQAIFRRYGGILYQQWDHGDISGQRCFEFDAHEIARVIEPLLARGVGCLQPFVTDNHQQHGATAHDLIQIFFEVDSQG